ncbi:DNA-directed RNA polymerase subunit beta' [Patescibacteria group bacterium]
MSTPEKSTDFFSSKIADFDAIRIKVASPDEIEEWSYGEVTKPETINYRTQRPEKEGLFSEAIFGPTKDWECYCGKYKRIRYKGIVCEKCGVEVTRSIVRRERMGHITLEVPVSHIWFLRGVPSKIGLILDLTVQELEKVIYFASYIITDVKEDAREEALKQVTREAKAKKEEISKRYQEINKRLKEEQAKAFEVIKDKPAGEQKKLAQRFEEELQKKNKEKKQELDNLQEAVSTAKQELGDLSPLRVISEIEYRELSVKYGHVFQAGIGAEAVRELVSKIDLKENIKTIKSELKGAVASKRKKMKRRLKLIQSMDKANIRPEWMFITKLPILPPDLRPMVQLDGGRFAASDLNDLYRRVINRNNRLKRLHKLNAPEVITRNEKRMLQEAVDALIDNNARRGKAVASTTGQRRTLKSLADMLKGKQGRFRQNLLGKRVDYSGRSVIVVGPQLKLHEAGIPKTMALELFKPFIIQRLIKHEFAYNVRSAGKLIEAKAPEVWDMLEEAIQGQYVLLNRAPTLHRLGIQAFEPVLIEGKAIQIHPMVCDAYNADFDGDQMAVHIPLTDKAREEAREIMLSSKNLLKPATGQPIVTATKDMVLGCYWMSDIKPVPKDKRRIFSTEQEVILAYEMNNLNIKDEIEVVLDNKERITTCAGRIIFNKILPEEFMFINELLDKKVLRRIVAEVLDLYGREVTAEVADRIKGLGFEYLTRSGLTWGMDDVKTPKIKAKLVADAEDEVEHIHDQYRQGLLTDDERFMKVIEIWSKVKDNITEAVEKELDRDGGAYSMIQSGARGSWGQLTQMMGMKGLVSNPSGRTIELPVKDNFKEGFNVLEYFISTHGTRKGMSDTALRTANAGYLTRRLVDVAQDVVVQEEDCRDNVGFTFTKKDSEEIGREFTDRVIGRVTIGKIVDPKTGEVVLKHNELITKESAEKLSKLDLSEITIRSIMTCRTKRGVCKRCYGYDLGNNKEVEIGQAVGIVAAQAIGEPGTQLTMRTFHTGGVAGGDITMGLPRVEELFEARQIKKPALIAEIKGKVSIEITNKNKILTITSVDLPEDTYTLTEKSKVEVSNRANVEAGELLYTEGRKKIKSKVDGTVRVAKTKLTVVHAHAPEKEYVVSNDLSLWVNDGDEIEIGQQLTDGHIDLYELHRAAGREAIQRYIMSEVQTIYSTQGQDVDDKHVEIIIRQMMSRVTIKTPGDSDFIEGEVINWAVFSEENDRLKAEGKESATADDILLGITKASLSTDSFLSAASFQQTARVLIDAAVTGRIDNLSGLKENVIIGRLIPAGTGYQLYKDRHKHLEETPKAEAAPEIKTTEKTEEVKE